MEYTSGDSIPCRHNLTYYFHLCLAKLVLIIKYIKAVRSNQQEEYLHMAIYLESLTALGTSLVAQHIRAPIHRARNSNPNNT